MRRSYVLVALALLAGAAFGSTAIAGSHDGTGATVAKKKKRKLIPIPGPTGPTGPQGVPGAQGAQGAPGASATTLQACRNSDAFGSPCTSGLNVGVTSTSHVAASSEYDITFNRNVLGCNPQATLQANNPGFISARLGFPDSNTVEVETRGLTGTVGDAAFFLSVFC
jgi:hypothetical protein